jgi:hypothetical protein
MHINTDGLRDREILHDKPKNSFRILVIGDSFIEAAQMKVKHSVSKRLEKMFAETAPKNIRYEVINAGFGNYGTAQEYLFYIERGRKYKADMVLLYFWPGNDFRDNSLELDDQAYFPKPFFSLDNGKLTRIKELQMPAKSKKTRTPTRLVGILQRSVFYNLAKQYLDIYMPSVSRALQRVGIFQAANPAIERGYDSSFYIHKKPLPRLWQEAIDLTEALLKKMKEAVESDNAQFVPIQIPYIETLVQMHPDTARARWFFLFAPDQNMEIGQPERITREIFERIGSPIFDPKNEYLREMKENGKEPHGPDNHLNEHGHAILTRATFNYLRDSGLLPGIKPPQE